MSIGDESEKNRKENTPQGRFSDPEKAAKKAHGRLPDVDPEVDESNLEDLGGKKTTSRAGESIEDFARRVKASGNPTHLTDEELDDAFAKLADMLDKQNEQSVEQAKQQDEKEEKPKTSVVTPRTSQKKEERQDLPESENDDAQEPDEEDFDIEDDVDTETSSQSESSEKDDEEDRGDKDEQEDDQKDQEDEVEEDEDDLGEEDDVKDYAQDEKDEDSKEEDKDDNAQRDGEKGNDSQRENKNKEDDSTQEENRDSKGDTSNSEDKNQNGEKGPRDHTPDDKKNDKEKSSDASSKPQGVKGDVTKPNFETKKKEKKTPKGAPGKSSKKKPPLPLKKTKKAVIPPLPKGKGSSASKAAKAAGVAAAAKKALGGKKNPSPFEGTAAGTNPNQARPGNAGPKDASAASSQDEAGRPSGGVRGEEGSSARDLGDPGGLVPARDRKSRNMMDKSAVLQNFRNRKAPVPKLPAEKPGVPGSKKSGCGPVVIAIIILITLFIGSFTMGGGSLGGSGGLGDISDEEKYFAAQEKCVLDDSGGKDSSSGRKGSGGRGVPEGEISKPGVFGEPGTDSMEGGEMTITSGFGIRWGEEHKGVDIARLGGPTSKDAIYAADDGIVGMSDCTVDGFGCAIGIISEDEGMGGVYLTMYGHMYPDGVLVKAGDEVEAGQLIAYQGNNGKSQGQHLHFEVGKTAIQDKGKFLPDGQTRALYYGGSVERIDPEDYVKKGINPDPDGKNIGVAKKDSDKDKDKGKDKKKDRNKKKDKSKEKDKDAKREKKKSSGDGILEDEDLTEKLVSEARKLPGKYPYVYGANGPDAFDCSGLVQWVYKQVGIEISRTTHTQEKEGEVVWDAAVDGGSYNEDDLKPGDLIFYQNFGHVALYVGNGMIVNAATDGVPLDQQIQYEPIAEGGSTPPHKIVRITDKFSSSVSKNGRGDKDTTEESVDNCDCETGETARSAFDRTSGQSNAQDQGDNYEANARLIIELGKKKKLSDDQIAFALALADAHTGLANIGSTNKEGAEVLDGDELTSSINHGPEGTSGNGAGRMGLFYLIAGKHGSVDDLMDKEWSANFVFSKIKSTPGITKDNWGAKYKELGLDYTKDPSAMKDRAYENLKKYGDDSKSKKTKGKNGASGKGGSNINNADWLPNQLEKFGVDVVEYPGWKGNGYGNFNGLRGMVAHHTGFNKGAPGDDADYIANNPNIAGGALSAQIFLDRDGTAHVLGTGVAWHAGMGEYPGWPTNNANSVSIGVEAAANGNDPWPKDQMDAYLRIAAAIVEKVGDSEVSDSNVISHYEWAGKAQGKWDPGAGKGDNSTLDMDQFRDSAQKYLEAYNNGEDLDDVDVNLDFDGIDPNSELTKGKGSKSKKDVCSTSSKSKKGKDDYSSEDLNTAEIPEELVPLIIEAANNSKHITPPILAGLLFQESSFNVRSNEATCGIDGPNGVACGVAQFMPAAWKQWGTSNILDRLDPELAIPAAAKFLDHLYEHALDVIKDAPGETDDPVELMLASYNGGPGCIMAQACGTPGKVPNCGDPNDFNSYAGQTYPYAKELVPKHIKKFSK